MVKLLLWVALVAATPGSEFLDQTAETVRDLAEPPVGPPPAAAPEAAAAIVENTVKETRSHDYESAPGPTMPILQPGRAPSALQ